MSPSNPLRPLRTSDLRGIAQLVTQATVGITGVVEGVHQSVWSTLGFPGSGAPGRTDGITGLVYGSIRSVAQLAGKGVDVLLASLQPFMESTAEVSSVTPRARALVAALNGVMGDRLLAANNPLATPMTLRYRGDALRWQDGGPPLSQATGKVLLLIHGLCMNDLQWKSQHSGLDHGEALASTLGYSPVYLRYNSGLHVSHNGRQLAAQLEQLIHHWPVSIEELTVVAHSMGGLLIRSALHYAKRDASCWPGHLKNIVFLGTPHHGVPLERAGNWVDTLLASTPYTAPFAKLGQLRSAGITDLRHGHLLDEDWQGRDRFQRKPDSRQVVPLPEGVACYSVVATKAAKRSTLADRLIGDGLVPLYSALGLHDDPRRCLALASGSQWIEHNSSHMKLLSNPEVTTQMLQWLTPVDDRPMGNPDERPTCLPRPTRLELAVGHAPAGHP